MVLEHIGSWLAGSILLAAGALLIGYAYGLRAGARKSNLAKDLRISAQGQRIARLEKALSFEPQPVHREDQPDAENRITEAQPQ